MSWSVNHYKRKMEKKCNWNRLCKKKNRTNQCMWLTGHSHWNSTGWMYVAEWLRYGLLRAPSSVNHHQLHFECSTAQHWRTARVASSLIGCYVVVSVSLLNLADRDCPSFAVFFFCDYLMSPDHCLFLCNGLIRVPTHFHFTIPYFSRTNSQLYK